MANTERRTGQENPAHQSEAHLVLSRPSDDGADAYCRDHLAADARAEPAPIVVVADGDLSDRLPGSATPGVVVAVDEAPRGNEAARDGAGDAQTSPATVFTSGDLGEVGRTVDGYLTDRASSGQRPTVCVDSLTGLLDRASVHGTYRFVYVLRRRVEDVGGDLHVHVDPSEHEEEILRTFFSVFERVVAFDDGGSPLP